jgi:hypothetical protein
MGKPLPYSSIRTTKEYDGLLNASYLRVKQEVEDVVLPPIQVIAVTGNQPPASKQFQDAIGALYGLAYGLKMGLKYRKLPRPRGYFDFKVGALGAFWWSTGETFEIENPGTLRWRTYLMVPAYVSRTLIEQVRTQATAKHSEVPYGRASLQTVNEGRSVQVLHVGPYDAEQPTIDRLHRYASDHGLAIRGRHHEIYISDPGRTKPEKLKTVIRLAVKTLRSTRRAPSAASAA